MATTVGSGTQLCVISTEHTLDTETAAGVYVASLNLTNAQNGDVFRLRVKTKVLTGDTAECIWDVPYANDQDGCPIVQTPPLLSMFEVVVTLTQTAGTGRNVPWSLVRVDA